MTKTEEPKRVPFIPQPKKKFTRKRLTDFLEASEVWCKNFTSQQEFEQWAMQTPKEKVVEWNEKVKSPFKMVINMVSREIRKHLEIIEISHKEMGDKCEAALHEFSNETVVEISNDKMGTRRIDRHHFKHTKEHNPYKDFSEAVSKYQKEYDIKLQELLSEEVEITPIFAEQLPPFSLLKEKDPFREAAKDIVM